MKSILRNFFFLALVALLLSCGTAKAQIVSTHPGSASSYVIAVGPLDELYATDNSTGSIIKIDPSGAVTTIATGVSTPGISDAYGMVRDASGNLFVTQVTAGTITKITPGGIVTTLTLTGTVPTNPAGIVIDNDGNLVVADIGPGGTGLIYKITPSGVSSLFATATNAIGLAYNAVTNTIYAGASSAIYKIDASGTVSTLAGTLGISGYQDGTGPAANFAGAENLVVDAAGNIFVADKDNNRIRKVTAAGVVTTFAGDGTQATVDGTGLGSSFSNPLDIKISAVTGNLYVIEDPGSIRIITYNTGLPVTWLALSATLSSEGNAKIAWQVDEIAVNHYTIQKSINGRQYINIGNISSKGSGTQKYSYTEPTILSGTAYYRIQQVDIDGKNTFSKLLKLKNSEADTEGLNVYPTLVFEGFSISSSTPQQVLLINNLGQPVKLIEVVSGEQQISMVGYSAGLYFIKSNNGPTKRIVKL